MSEANEINKTICETIKFFLSEKGKRIYYPKKGIGSQSAEAKDCTVNATIGVAKDDSGNFMSLKSLHPKPVPYAPAFGIPILRTLWQERIKNENIIVHNNLSLPVVTSGITSGLFIFGSLFLNEGDEVIVPELYWPNYNLVYKTYFNCKFKKYKTFEKGGLDLISFEKSLKNSKKRIIVLNFPHNPTGYSPSHQEALKMAEIICKNSTPDSPTLVLIDDAYLGLNYQETNYNYSMFKLLSNKPNVVAIKADGISKEYYSWGMRMGFLTLSCGNNKTNNYDGMENKIAGLIRAQVSSVPRTSQESFINAYGPKLEEEKRNNDLILKERYQELNKLYNENKDYENYFELIPSNSGYFFCIKPKLYNCEDLRLSLIQNYQIGVISTGGVLRVALSSLKKTSIKYLLDSIAGEIKRLFNDI
jgi:aspartate/methionine/tyrosine aminotransferase